MSFPGQTLDAVLAHRAGQEPGALAFATEDESLSYGKLRSDAEELAAGLARLGVGPGDRVALLLPAGLDFIRVFFALQRLAAIPCAFDPGGPPANCARRAARIRPHLVLVAGSEAGGLTGAVAGAGMRCAALEEVPRTAAELPPPAGNEEDVAFLQPTSGTSGEPRAAVILQRNVLASLRASRDLLGIGPGDVLVSWAPPWHDLGLIRFILGPVYFGSPCHLVPPAIRTLPLWLETASRVRATMLGAPDFAWRLATRLVDPRGLDLSALRYAIDGGEPVRRSTILAFEERFGVPGVIRPGYGLAEATLGVTCLRPGEPLRVDGRGNVSCGRPLPGVEVRIDPEADNIRDVGEILVRGPAVFAGYFEAEEATAEALRDGWLHTGDIGRLDADGHLYVLGRKRALIKRGGAPLAPRELEEAAQSVPGLRVAAAVGIPPAPGAATEEVVVAVEADPQAAASPPEFAAAVAGAIEAAIGFAPDRVLVLAPRTIPRTANGKIRHQKLRADLIEGELERRGAVLFNSRR
ncbi:MAG TPA: AMP-binding protein [Thermoanaerobaculia bacterium]